MTAGQGERTAREEAAAGRRHKKFLADMTAYQRVEGRRGLPARLKSTVDVGLLILDQLKAWLRCRRAFWMSSGSR